WAIDPASFLAGSSESPLTTVEANITADPANNAPSVRTVGLHEDGSVCRSAGKHPRQKRWQEKASRSGADIEELWTKWPLAGVGIVTGAESGLFVLDVDPDSGGFETLAKLEAEHGKLPHTYRVRTGSEVDAPLPTPPAGCLTCSDPPSARHHPGGARLRRGREPLRGQGTGARGDRRAEHAARRWTE
ncbi:MAG: bifunctional DNA primase/polymerase, partial [Pseudonocardiaceae bacterium]